MTSDDDKDLSAADALASAASGREAIVRRLSIPWPWDASTALLLGVYMALVAYLSAPWTGVVIALWVVVQTAVNRERVRRTGVVSPGKGRRGFDWIALLMYVAAVPLFVLGIALRSHWNIAPAVAAFVAATLAFLGARRLQRRAIDRALNQS